jgi:hypothetical protein
MSELDPRALEEAARARRSRQRAYFAFVAIVVAAFAAYYVYVKGPYEAERAPPAAQDPRP